MLRERGSQLPRHMIIQSDNTTRETRNQNLMKWAAHLICSEIFDSITFCFYKVGHTHCEVDQRFSVLAHCLNQCTGLQTAKAGPNSETKFGVTICNTMFWKWPCAIHNSLPLFFRSSRGKSIRLCEKYLAGMLNAIFCRAHGISNHGWIHWPQR